MNDPIDEIKRGERFAFGKNWARFSTVINDERIQESMSALQTMLGVTRLDGMSFIDIGSGSGLSSLAAWRLGAKVHSFDYDEQSVATTRELRSRYCDDESMWHIESGSVLDNQYIRNLGNFDIVYSWGVLHHTGNMWQAIENIVSLVAPNGKLFIALYNDQGLISEFWLFVKRSFCAGLIRRILIIAVFFTYFFVMGIVSDLLRKKNPIKRYTDNSRGRGMSVVSDWIDWLGGYPFETAKVEDVFEFYKNRGFSMTKLITRQSLGCNEFVFQKLENMQSNYIVK